MEYHTQVECTSNIYIHQVVEILGERMSQVTIEENTSAIDQDVEASHFLDDSQSHFVLLQIDAQITLNDCGLSRILSPY